MGSYLSYLSPEENKPQNQPFRLSDFGEDDMIVHRLKFIKGVLTEQRNEYQDNEAKEIEKAKALKKVNLSEAKFHLQKVKISRAMKNRIQDRIYLVTKQLNNLESVKEDIEFAKVIESSNQLLVKLNQEVDSDSLKEALMVMNEGESDKFNDLLAMFQATEESQLKTEYAELDASLGPSKTSLSGSGKVQTVEELEKKEAQFC